MFTASSTLVMTYLRNYLEYFSRSLATITNLHIDMGRSSMIIELYATFVRKNTGYKEDYTNSVVVQDTQHSTSLSTKARHSAPT